MIVQVKALCSFSKSYNKIVPLLDLSAWYCSGEWECSMHLQGCDSGLRLKALNLDFFFFVVVF